jgi:hypothetical protein
MIGLDRNWTLKIDQCFAAKAVAAINRIKSPTRVPEQRLNRELVGRLFHICPFSDLLAS